MKKRGLLFALGFSMLIQSTAFAASYRVRQGVSADPSLLTTEQTVEAAEAEITAEWVQDEKGWWYSYSDGTYAHDTWIWTADKWYYVNSEGYIHKGFLFDGTDWYYTNAEGELVEGAYPEILAILRSGDLRAAYNYSCFRWSRSSTNAALGTSYFAFEAFNNRTGNCYYMAGCFAYLARLMGYDARQMSGLVPLRRGGLGPHSWVVIDGTVYDPDFQVESGKNGYGIHYGQSGTWRYQSYSEMPW